MENFNLKKFLSESKFLENSEAINESSENTLKGYYSSRSKGVRQASEVIDQLISEAGIDTDLNDRLIDAISDLVDEIESDSDY
jgi:phosphoenolpyruvate synthase/pyruvate phosphate dikinase